MLDNGAVENLPIFVTVYAVDAADLFHAITNRIAAAAKASAITAAITMLTWS